VVDRALKLLGRYGECQTEHLPIGGGDVGAVTDFLARQRDQAAGLVDDECLAELVHGHGSAWIDVLEYVRRDPRLGARIHPERPFVLASVHHAVEHEMATCIADVALRRTDAGNLGDPDGRVGRAIGAELQRLLGLSDQQLARQLADYLDQLAIDGLGPPATAGLRTGRGGAARGRSAGPCEDGSSLSP
jgi:glycerol-3-phosphate dehydrogenase